MHERCKCAEGKQELTNGLQSFKSLKEPDLVLTFMVVAYIHRKACSGACFRFNLQIGNVSFVSLL